MHLGFFASYIFLFIVGCIAWRGKWLEKVTMRRALPWLLVSLATIAFSALRTGAVAQSSASPPSVNAAFAIVQILYVPLVAWGTILTMLALFRRYLNHPSALCDFLSARAYAVYIVHIPVLMALGIALLSWHAPTGVKFFVTGTLTLLLCNLIASLLLLLPGARGIL